MKLKDAIDLGCYFCTGVCAINVLATIGRIVPGVGLTLIALLVVAAIALAISCRFYPQVAPTATYLTMVAIFGLVLGVVN